MAGTLRRGLMLVILGALGGCSYNSAADVKPAYDVYSNYGTRIPGHFALYVDDGDMSRDVKVRGFTCSAHKYPTDARTAFRLSALKTLENLVERIELVDTRPTIRDMEARGLDGLIQIAGKDMNVKLILIPGFWSAEMEAEVELAAGVQVDGRSGRLLGTTVSADADALGEAGGACEGGAVVISEAATEAIKNLMQVVGERIANSPRVREAHLAPRPLPGLAQGGPAYQPARPTSVVPPPAASEPNRPSPIVQYPR